LRFLSKEEKKKKKLAMSAESASQIPKGQVS